MSPPSSDSSHFISISGCFNYHRDASISLCTMWLFSFRCLHKIANTLCLSIYLLPWCLRHLWIYMIFSKSITYSRVSSISLILIISITIHGDRKFKNWNNLIWNMQESTALMGYQIFLWKPEQFFSSTLYVLTLHFFFLKKRFIQYCFTWVSVCLHVCICTTCLHGTYVELCVPIEISLSWAYIPFIMLNPTLCLVWGSCLSLASVFLYE